MSKSERIPDDDGSIWWCLEGTDLLHREDGPALEWPDGDKEWFINGVRHRIEGPAVEFTNGAKLWFYNGKEISCSSQEEFESLLKLRAFW